MYIFCNDIVVKPDLPNGEKDPIIPFPFVLLEPLLLPNPSSEVIPEPNDPEVIDGFEENPVLS